MKKLIYLIPFFLACCKQGPEPQPPEVCDFGLVAVMPEKRLDETELNAGKKPIKQPGKGKPKPPANQPPAILLLDFDGHKVKNTAWNYMPEIVCLPSGLTTEQQQQILDTVAFRYNQFNVQVTTDEALFLLADPRKRMRCIITQSWEWYGRVGGVAQPGSFGWTDDTPCFVFSILLGFNTKKIQGAAAHELGHTFGLYHQALWDDSGIKLSDYNPGCCGWAPIMGLPYHQPNELWYEGRNSYGQMQNDSVIIKSKL